MKAPAVEEFFRRLAEGVLRIPGVALAQPVQANAVFVNMPAPALKELQNHYFFYTYADGSIARWMASFDTTEEDVDRLAARVKEVMV